MAYQSPYQEFIFEDYSFNETTQIAEFHYSFDSQRHFTERIMFSSSSAAADLVNNQVLEKALQLAFYVAGTSYYKTFPTKKISFKKAKPDAWQADFLNNVYRDGLSQFYFENNLGLEDMPVITGEGEPSLANEYKGEGIIALQSGGKDSLLLATLLSQNNIEFSPWYIQYGDSHPQVLDQLSQPLQTVRRHIDKEALKAAANEGALNGHIPVTYIVLAYALIDAVLQGKDTILAAIGAEGAEAHEFIGDMPVNHQWAKTWDAEQLFAKYVTDYISPNIHVGSPLRGFSELKIAELFTQHAWEKFGHSFSSCNRANYQQGSDNTELKWCGECPKCANSYLLFAPFVEPKELRALFGGEDLFAKASLTETFKGLLGIEGVMKPFECVGETAELRRAYHMAIQNYPGQHHLPFDVPSADFDYQKIQDHNKELQPSFYTL